MDFGAVVFPVVGKSETENSLDMVEEGSSGINVVKATSDAAWVNCGSPCWFTRVKAD